MNKTNPTMRYYPACLDIRNRICLVVGGGSVGTRKAARLASCGARVTVISPIATAKLRKLAEAGTIALNTRSYRSADLKGAFLVIGATDDEKLNRKISRDAAKRNILCNIADRPEVCSFVLPSIVRRGDLVITISTSGKSPALAKKLRKTLEEQFGKEYAALLQLLGAIRQRLLGQRPKPQAYKYLFNQLMDHGLLEMVREGREEEIDLLLHQTLGEGYRYRELIQI
jgi:precorrin-2 dehydrogenase/sirohydrochlorin ferrochelatase